MYTLDLVFNEEEGVYEVDWGFRARIRYYFRELYTPILDKMLLKFQKRLDKYFDLYKN